MARALALAARFTSDHAVAADLYLRAGRSAAAQGDVADARIWLDSARKMSPDLALRGVAEQVIRQLPPR